MPFMSIYKLFPFFLLESELTFPEALIELIRSYKPSASQAIGALYRYRERKRDRRLSNKHNLSSY